jgi:hypothetical protein
MDFVEWHQHENLMHTVANWGDRTLHIADQVLVARKVRLKKCERGTKFKFDSETIEKVFTVI